MKKVLVTIFLIYSVRCFSQSRFPVGERNVQAKQCIDTCMLRVTYQFISTHISDQKIVYWDNAALDVGRRTTHYFSLSADKVDSMFYRFAVLYPNSERGVDVQQYLSPGEYPRYENIYTDHPKKGFRTVLNRLWETDFLYEEPINQLYWQLNFIETQTLLGYVCHKATCSFRGRNYTVWYTTEIPVQSGPWKFSGLPGLILSAQEDKGFFSWQALSVKQSAETYIYVYNPKIRTSYGQMAITRTTRLRWLEIERLITEDPLVLMSTLGMKVMIEKEGRNGSPLADDIHYLYTPLELK